MQRALVGAKEQIGSAAFTFRFSLTAPSSGSLGWTWYAQARQAEQPRQAAMASMSSLTIQPSPEASISQVSNIVAGRGDLNETRLRRKPLLNMFLVSSHSKVSTCFNLRIEYLSTNRWNAGDSV